MAVPRFYCETLDREASTVELSESAAHHARTVLRLRPADEVVVFNGCGLEGRGEVIAVDRRRVVVRIAGVEERGPEGRRALTLATAWPKGTRQEILIEKCTELGVAAIWPMICARSVVQPSEQQAAKWRNWAIRAAEQSQRDYLPNIASPRSFAEVIQHRSEFDQVLLADPQAETTLDNEFAIAGQRLLVLIGPEGGFSPEEIRQASESSIKLFRMFTPLLRVETAAIAIAARLLV